MSLFRDHSPNALTRFAWYQKGFRVLCSDCWFMGEDIDYDNCPDCNSDKIEFIFEDNELVDKQESIIRCLIS